MLSTCDHFRDTAQSILDIKLGFHWQMPHVGSASDVHHLHNTTKWKNSLMSTPDRQVENPRLKTLDKHLPQLRLHRFLASQLPTYSTEASNARSRRLVNSTWLELPTFKPHLP